MSMKLLALPPQCDLNSPLVKIVLAFVTTVLELFDIVLHPEIVRAVLLDIDVTGPRQTFCRKHICYWLYAVRSASNEASPSLSQLPTVQSCDHASSLSHTEALKL